MLASPFDYRGNVLGVVQSTERPLGCKSNTDLLGMGARSTYDYAFGSSMNLPIRGIQPCAQCSADTTGSKRFRPAYYQPGIRACGKCSVIDPTDPCVYKSKEMRPESGCSFGYARDANDYQSPSDGNRFSQYRWG